MATDKVYAPINVKARDGRFGEEFRIGAHAEKLIEFIKANKNAKGYINLEMTKRKNTGKFGETHSVTLDTWEPQPRKSSGESAPSWERGDGHNEVGGYDDDPIQF